MTSLYGISHGNTFTNIIPTSLNWASNNNPIGVPVLPPVHNQGLCGACWAFVSVSAVEASLHIKLNRKISLSPQELIDCDRASNKGCYGGNPSNAFHYITLNGISTSDDYPYEEKDGQCQPKSTKPRVYITGVVSVAPYNENSLMTTLAMLGPVATGICGTDKSFLYYQSGVFSNINCCREQNHAVLIVGYGRDDKLGLDYWIIQNSWGTYWGENGFMRLLRSHVDDSGICGIDTLPSIPFGPYIVNDVNSNRLIFNVTETVYDHTTEEIKYFWNKITKWLSQNWKSFAALFSSSLLTISIVLLMYTVYLDRYLIHRYDNSLDLYD